MTDAELDALIAGTPAAAADPIDELIARTPATPEVGPAEHFINRWSNSILGGKPFVDVFGTLLTQATRPFGGGSGKSNVRLTDKAKAELRAMGDEVPEEASMPGFLDMHREIRDRRNRRTEAGAKQNPEVDTLATIASIPSNIALGMRLPVAAAPAAVARYSPAAARVLANTGTGAAYGTAFALTNGNADLTRGEFGKAAHDIAGTEGWKSAVANYTQGNKTRAFLDLLGAGAPGGALGGLLPSAVIESGGRLVARPLHNSSISQGRRVLTNGADTQSERLAVPEAAVGEALESRAIRPFGTTESTLTRLNKLTDEQGAAYAKIVSDLEAMGVEGPEVRRLADELFDQYMQRFPKTGADKSAIEVYAREAENIENVGAGSPRLRLSQSEDIKRDLQHKAKYGRREESLKNESMRGSASIIRQANEDAIDAAAAAAGPGSPIATTAADFVPVKTRLGNLLDAEAAATRGTARGAQRQSGMIPGPIEGAIAVASGNPGALAVKPTVAALKNFGTSTYASGAYNLAKALRTGTASPAMSRYVAQNRAPLMSYADDPLGLYASNDEDEMSYALAEILRRR